MKNSYYVKLHDIVTKVPPLRLVYPAPLYEPTLTPPSSFSTELAYMNMAFIPELACTASSECHFKSKKHAQISQFSQK